MAFITRFIPVSKERLTLHSETDCGYAIGEVNGNRVLVLETYGTTARKMPGKISQSVQLDISSARALLQVLLSAFPDLSTRK